MQAWQPKEGGLLATGGEDGKVLIYNVLDTIEGVPYMCVPCASAELPEEGVTQIVWGSDNQLYTGHTSGESLHLINDNCKASSMLSMSVGACTNSLAHSVSNFDWLS